MTRRLGGRSKCGMRRMKHGNERLRDVSECDPFEGLYADLRLLVVMVHGYLRRSDPVFALLS